MAWFIAGSLDALAAIFILSHGNASSIFRFISSGVYGQGAFTGGESMIYLGVALHYLIALSFTIFYFIIFKLIPILHKNILLSAILYGIFIYVVMNLVVLSLINVQVPKRTMVSVVRNAIILIAFVAFPIVYIARIYYLKTKSFLTK